jgi:hypothetical protein
MTNIKIELFTCIDGLMLAVYKDTNGYRFEVINFSGETFGHYATFSSAEAAENKGRAWIRVACGGKE